MSHADVLKRIAFERVEAWPESMHILYVTQPLSHL